MATLRQRGRSWYLCWWESGREQKVSLGAIPERDARAALKLKQRELQRIRVAGIVDLPSTPVIRSLNGFATDYLAWHAAEFPHSSERIEGILRHHILPAFGPRALDALRREDLERYKHDRLRTGAKPATVAKELRTLQAVLNRAVTLGEMPANQVRGVRPPKDLDSRPMRWYTALELRRLYKCAKALPGSESIKGLPPNGVADFAPVWQLMANTGMRRSEAAQLRWADVGKGVLRIVSTADARTKSGRWRQVPLSPGALGALERLRATRDGDYVIPRLHRGSLSRAFVRAARRANLDGSLHSLRHTFCAHLVTRGVPLRTVQVLAGHASFATTERYAHLAPDYLKGSVSGLKL